MAIYNEKEKLTFLCTDCGEVYNEEIDVTMSSARMNIVAFNAEIYVECEKCKSACIQVGDKIANAISILYKKGYPVVRSDQGSYGEGVLYAPYIQLEYMGALEPPKGWVYAGGCDGSTPQKMMVPAMSFGAIESTKDKNVIEHYNVLNLFKTEEEFINKQDHYIRNLEKWAGSLDQSLTLKVPDIGITRDNSIADC